jgi:uncharacterized membrane protein YhaH (DUF805 family)
MDITEFLAWYLAPWRRIGRTPFNVVFGLISIIPLAISLGGLGGMLAGGTDTMQAIQNIQQGNMAAMGQLEGTLRGLASVPPAQTPMPWADMINAVLIVLLIPLVRMRLRDIGWQTPTMHWGGLAIVVGPVFLALLKVLGVEIPMGFTFTIMQCVVLGLLCIKQSKPAPERPLPPS